MKKNTITLFVILITSLAHAQTVTLDWVKRIGGASFDEAYALAVAPDGTICVAGSFNGLVDFNPSPSASSYLNSTAASDDIFICKLDAAGNFIWAKSMGGDYDESAMSLAIDASGNIYTTGFFQDIVDFDPSTKQYNLTSTGLDDLFISKLDAKGNFVWAQQIGGNGLDYGNSITTRNGSIYISGAFQLTADFDPTANTSTLTSVGEWDIHVTKIDTAGNFIWAKAMGGLFTDGGYSITTDAAENIYTTGLYQDDVDFDPSAKTYILKSQGGTEIFISKLDSAGQFIWAKRMGGTSDDQGLSIIADDSGNIYSTGYFTGTVDFNPGPPKYNLIGAGGVDVYILKLDVKGNFSWAKQISGTGTEVGNYITLDKKGNLYSTGYFDGTVDFNPGTASYNITSTGAIDIFIYKLDTSGNFVWAHKLGGKLNEFGQTLTVDGLSDVYTTGYFEDTANFALDTTLTQNLISAGSNDIFLHKIKQCEATSAKINIMACDSFLFGKQYYNNTGLYYDTLINSRGCDSIITLSLNVTKLNTTVTQTGNILTANDTGVSYQWVDCGNNFAPIVGETKQSFKPTVNGNYAVIISSTACTDTSNCYQILNAGIAETIENHFEIFPNPTQRQFTLTLQKKLQHASLKIYNITGQLIMQKTNLCGESFNCDISEYGAGIYLVEVTEGDNRMVGSVVIGE